MAAALATAKIDTCIYYPISNHLQEAFRAPNRKLRLPLPVTEELQNEVLSLPIHAALNEHDVLRVASAVRAFFESTPAIPLR